MAPQSNPSAGSHGLFFLGLVPPGPDIVYIATLVFDDKLERKRIDLREILLCNLDFKLFFWQIINYFAKLLTIITSGGCFAKDSRVFQYSQHLYTNI